jgi:hypothetical protein
VAICAPEMASGANGMVLEVVGLSGSTERWVCDNFYTVFGNMADGSSLGRCAYGS